MQVFISYAREQSDSAKFIRAWIEKNQPDWSVFIDTHPDQGIKATEKWKLSIRNAIKQSDFFIILLTRSWQSSKTCWWEYELAETAKLKLIPLLIDKEMTRTDAREELGEREIIDLSHQHKEKDGYAKLLNALGQSPNERKQIKWFSKKLTQTVAFYFGGVLLFGVAVAFTRHLHYPPSRSVRLIRMLKRELIRITSP